MERTKAQKIRQRTLVGLLLTGVLVGLLWLAGRDFGPRVVALVIFVCGLIGVLEATRMTLPWRAAKLWVLGLCVAVSTGTWLYCMDPALDAGFGSLALPARYALASLLCVVLPLVLFAVLQAPWRHGPSEATDTGVEVSAAKRWQALLWLTVPLAFLYPVRAFGGIWALVALVILSKIGDIAGYYVGNALGKRKPFPNLSPGKTQAGCVGSLIAGVIAGVLCANAGWFGGEFASGVASGFEGGEAQAASWWLGALAGASINVAAQAGDLYESYWKRKTGVKDSGTWFGPSGGMLDLVDSFLFTAPLAALSWPWLFGWLS